MGYLSNPELPLIYTPGAHFSKSPETFRAQKAAVKSQALRLQSCIIHIFTYSTEVPFIHEVSSAYISPFLDTDELKWLFGPENFPGLSRNGSLDGKKL